MAAARSSTVSFSFGGVNSVATTAVLTPDGCPNAPKDLRTPPTVLGVISLLSPTSKRCCSEVVASNVNDAPVKQEDSCFATK